MNFKQFPNMTTINQGAASTESYKLLPAFDSVDTSVQNEDSCNKIPYEREDPHLLSGLQSSMMIFKFCVGVGWFSLPASFQHSGLLMGIFLNLLCGALTIYGMQRLVETSWEVAQRTGNKTAYYGDIGAACGRLLNEKWSVVGRLTVDVILSVSAFCMLCPVVLFIADIWKQAFEEQGIVKMDISIWISIAYIFISPSTFIRRPDFLAWFAIVANILEFVVALCVFANIFSRTSSWKVNNTVTWSKLPLSIGIIFFAFEIAPFILSVENLTRKPEQLPRVINVVMIGISLIYSFIGSVGFMSCYPDCKDSIILNLPSEWYFSVAKFLMGLSATCGAVLISFVLYNVVEPILKAQVPEDRFYLVSQLFRIFVLTFSSAISASVPQLGNILSLAGSIVTAFVGFLLPAVSHTLLLYHQISRFTIAANFAFSIFGLLFLFSGVYTSIVEIVNDY